MGSGHPDAFPATRPSVVRSIGSVDPDVRRDAYDALVRQYWRPVYAYIRLRWHRDPVEAQDLTQEFFTRAFEKEYLQKYDPARARFRTFVRTCLDGFLANEHQAASRLKRGGGVVLESLDFSSADAELARRSGAGDLDSDAWFRDEWIRSLFSTAVDELRARCQATSRETAFAIFHQYDVDGSDEPARPTYATLAGEFNISTAEVTSQLAWARRAFRDVVLATLRTQCATDEEFRAEARDVLGISPP
jgi:RNA polymerase sigma factor (sigma-70 family)